MVQYPPDLDTTFAAIADSTRRGILERLGFGEASITDLSQEFEMSLTGIKKHIRILEEANLVTTEKVGRVRTCRLGTRRLNSEIEWISMYERLLDEQPGHRANFRERTTGESLR